MPRVGGSREEDLDAKSWEAKSLVLLGDGCYGLSLRASIRGVFAFQLIFSWTWWFSFIRNYFDLNLRLRVCVIIFVSWIIMVWIELFNLRFKFIYIFLFALIEIVLSNVLLGIIIDLCCYWVFPWVFIIREASFINSN